MSDPNQLLMVRVQPCGILPVCDEVDAVYPRGKPFHAAEPVLQLIPVSIARGADVFPVACGDVVLLFLFDSRLLYEYLFLYLLFLSCFCDVFFDV